ncbi:MAG: hypothetical protein OMM_12979 [Candidatus Magnetoglobus multicellularis str. Araruama]|uniref:Uncharacterized protein n=1 Tax=Candidatus Magnetoglobus multicellularis str. Araruama TaxID=890399 RepID=A0A1V1NUR2_9BACT|nr:MAG: hypothetical protein OMM_12979 [Candidatus Magnetoglobus multicellularis str. Araruama]
MYWYFVYNRSYYIWIFIWYEKSPKINFIAYDNDYIQKMKKGDTMFITELIPSYSVLSHVEKLQLMQVLLRDIAAEKNVEIESTEILKMRPIGLLKDKFSVPNSFFDPLPDELINAFEGQNY